MISETHRSTAPPVPAHGTAALDEALMTGALGAVTIMVWFLLLDTIAGRPLYTPSVLGTVLLQEQGAVASLHDLPVSPLRAAQYTVFHAFAFWFVGYVAARLFGIAERNPTFIFGLLLLGIFFFSGFIGLTLLVEPSVLEVVTVPAVLTANVLAACVMGRYLWRRHPLDLRKLL